MFNYPVRLCVWYLCHYYWGKLPMKQKGLLTLWPVLSLPLWWRCWYTTATRRHDEVSSSALINRENPNTSIFSHLWGTKSSYLNVFACGVFLIYAVILVECEKKPLRSSSVLLWRRELFPLCYLHCEQFVIHPDAMRLTALQLLGVSRQKLIPNKVFISMARSILF